jgi:hypothetical protein
MMKFVKNFIPKSWTLTFQNTIPHQFLANPQQFHHKQTQSNNYLIKSVRIKAISSQFSEIRRWIFIIELCSLQFQHQSISKTNQCDHRDEEWEEEGSKQDWIGEEERVDWIKPVRQKRRNHRFIFGFNTYQSIWEEDLKFSVVHRSFLWFTPR